MRGGLGEKICKKQQIMHGISLPSWYVHDMFINNICKRNAKNNLWEGTEGGMGNGAVSRNLSHKSCEVSRNGVGIRCINENGKGVCKS